MWKHFIVDKARPGLDSEGEVAYHAVLSDGTECCCAIGLIDRDGVTEDVSFDNEPLSVVLERSREAFCASLGVDDINEEDLEFLCDIQRAHDMPASTIEISVAGHIEFHGSMMTELRGVSVKWDLRQPR